MGHEGGFGSPRQLEMAGAGVVALVGVRVCKTVPRQFNAYADIDTDANAEADADTEAGWLAGWQSVVYFSIAMYICLHKRHGH